MERTIILVAVEYNSEKTHIAKAQGLLYTGGSPKVEVFSKDKIIEMIENGYKVYSLAKDDKGVPSSSEVIPYEHGGQKFLKTKPNKAGADNLGELPPITG